MADAAKVRERIREIAQARNNVTVEEIEWVVNQLRGTYDVNDRPTNSGHGHLYRIGNRIFSVCVHHKGSKQVKSCYVDEFIDAMTDLGWYED